MVISISQELILFISFISITQAVKALSYVTHLMSIQSQPPNASLQKKKACPIQERFSFPDTWCEIGELEVDFPIQQHMHMQKISPAHNKCK